jgi:hypothetical protein
MLDSMTNTNKLLAKRQQMKPGDLVFIWPEWPDEYATRIGVVRDVYTDRVCLIRLQYDERGMRRNSPQFFRVDAFGLWVPISNYIVIPRPGVIQRPDEPERHASGEAIPKIKPGDIVFRRSSASGLASLGVVRRVHGDVAIVAWLVYDDSGDRPEFHSCEEAGCLLLDREDYAVILRPDAPYADEECEEEDD